VPPGSTTRLATLQPLCLGRKLKARVATCIVSQVALQATITHHGTVPNNLNLVPTSVHLSPQQLIVATTNIPPTINALAFTDPMGEFF